jgi:Tol biopolymer transport system component
LVHELSPAAVGSGVFLNITRLDSLDFRSQIAFVSLPDGVMHSITNDISNYSGLSVSADDRIIATVLHKDNRSLFFLPASGFTGTPPSPALTQERDFDSFGWSATGDLYLDEPGKLVRVSPDGNNRVVLMNKPSGEPAGCGVAGSVAPKSFPIVFIGGHHSPSGIDGRSVWRSEADGSNPREISDTKSDFGPVCSRDGKWVYYYDAQAGLFHRVSIDGGKSMIIPNSEIPGGIVASGYSDIAPNGTTLIFLATISPTPGPASQSEQKIVLLPLDPASSQARRILDPNPLISKPPVFSPDGKSIVYAIRENGVENFWLQPIDGAGPGGGGRRITNFTSDQVSWFEFSPDGKTLGVLRNHPESDVILLRDSASEK